MKISYPSLSSEDKKAVAERLETRKEMYVEAMTNAFTKHKHLILLIGDRPGPAAPLDPSYHHTPFYSTKYCSGWLNAALHLSRIPEHELIWINSADKDGNPTNKQILRRLCPDTIICLGGNAEKWMKNASETLDAFYTYYKFDHPQYHKRFKNSEEYPLIKFLREIFYPLEYF